MTRRFDRDLVVALVSGFIGALALAVSTYNVGGIGPAEIRSVRVFVDDKPVEDWPMAVARMTGKKIDEGWGYSTMSGTLLTAGQTRNVLIVHDRAIGAVLFNQQQRLRAEICYCSALEDCWLLERNVPRQVSRCPDGSDLFHD